MIRICQLFSFALLFPIFSAQAGKLSGITAVQIDSEAGKPEYFLYYGTTDATMGALFGVGAMIGGMGPDKEGEAFEARLKGAGFTIEKQVLADLKKQIATRKIFTQGGPYRLHLEVTDYGLMVAPTGYTRLKPVLKARIVIEDANGKQIYSTGKGVNEMDDLVKGQTFEEYSADIQILIRDLKTLSAKTAERLAANLEKDQKGTPDSPSAKPKTSSSKSR